MHTFKHFAIDDEIRNAQAFARYCLNTIDAAAGSKKPTVASAVRRVITVRPGNTYRGARRNQWHRARRVCESLRTARKQIGLPRSAFDRLRRQTQQLNVHGEPHGAVAKRTAPVIRFMPPVAKQPEPELSQFDVAQLAKAEARRARRNAKRAAQSQAQRRAA